MDAGAKVQCGESSKLDDRCSISSLYRYDVRKTKTSDVRQAAMLVDECWSRCQASKRKRRERS